MNENDKKTRKQWFVTWILYLIYSFINILLPQLFDPSFRQFPLAVRYGIGAVSLLSAFGFSFVFYHCSYKKPGTKLLTFCLVLTAISLVSIPILYLTGQIRPSPYIPFYGAYLLVNQGMGVWWFIVSWKMLKINKRLHALEDLESTQSVFTSKKF